MLLFYSCLIWILKLSLSGCHLRTAFWSVLYSPASSYWTHSSLHDCLVWNLSHILSLLPLRALSLIFPCLCHKETHSMEIHPTHSRCSLIMNYLSFAMSYLQHPSLYKFYSPRSLSPSPKFSSTFICFLTASRRASIMTLFILTSMDGILQQFFSVLILFYFFASLQMVEQSLFQKILFKS